MNWQPEIDELNHRQALAREMGGEAGIARQRKRGKLTVRERIAAISDAGSFQEIGGLAGSAVYENGHLASFTPANTVIGTARLNGRKVVLNAGDFTVRGGAADAAVGNKGGYAQRLAGDWRLPYVRLLDAAGGSVRTFEQIGRTYIPVSSSTPGNRAAAVHGAGRVGRPRVGRRPAGGRGVPVALQPHGEGHQPGLSGRAAGGQGGARLRRHQGGAGRTSARRSTRPGSSTTWRQARPTPST